MIKICTRLLRYNITVPRIDMTRKRMLKQTKIDFFPIVGHFQQKLGACVLNQPANQNLLTGQLTDELARFLLSYHYDHSVENILIESKSGVFSHGVDYKRFMEDPQYLDQLSKLAVILARLNKPTIAQISGGVKGAAAYILSMINTPLGYINSYLKIDEPSRGMIPIMGGSHRLARLPLHLGFFLALTSEQINSQQMAQLGLLKGGIRDGVHNSQIRKKLCEANLYFREKFRYRDYEQDDAVENVERDNVDRNKHQFQRKLRQRQAELLSTPSRNINLKFATNQHLLARSDFVNLTNPFNQFAQNDARNINNYYMMRLQRPLNYLKQNDLIELYHITGIKIKRFDVAKIDQIFAKNNIEDIVAALQRQNSDWAQQALLKIKGADPLALQLTFQLLKKAQTQSWIRCVETEYAVARKLAEESTLHLKVQKHGSYYVLHNKYTNGGLSSVPKQVVHSYFERAQGDYKFEHQVPKDSLHPYNDYYKEVPDSIRTYLNRENFSDRHLPEQNFQIKRFLNNNRINSSSQVYDVNLLRQKVYKKLEAEKQTQAIAQRLSHLAQNNAFLQNYQHQRQQYLDNLDNSALQDLIQQQIKSIFESKFHNRFVQFQQKTAHVIGLENRIQLFKQIKETILKNIIYNGADYEDNQKDESPYVGPIYFDEKGRDIFSSVNKHIQSDPPLKQLTQDLSKGLSESQSFNQYSEETLPKFFGTPPYLAEHQEVERQNWAAIKDLYDDKPQVVAEALIYKEMIIQASRTSEQLAGYLGWTAQNFYDLIENSPKHKQTYGQLATDVISEIKSIRQQKLTKLAEVEQERNAVLKKGLFTAFYQFKDEQRMRQVFPYYVNQTLIPGEFRRSFLTVLDSTLKQFTDIQNSNRNILLKQELGLLDRWINKDIVRGYTDYLKYDIEYISSYLYILFVKQLLTDIKIQKKENTSVDKLTDHIRDKYHIDFHFNTNNITISQIDHKIIHFLYFLMDMHSNAKKHIKSPQSKLIDFINRLKVAYENRQDTGMPYSFEGLMLLIAKDRQKIYDRFLNEKFTAQPQFLLSYINRQSKLTQKHIFANNTPGAQYQDETLRSYFNQHYDTFKPSRRLVQNYFYYMMQFEKYIHKICGKDSFLPSNFIDPKINEYNQQCNKILSPSTHEQWLKDQVQQILEQLLNEREQMERKLTRGQLLRFDDEFCVKLSAESIKRLIKNKVEEEIFIVKNLYSDNHEYGFQATEEEEGDEKYTRVKRLMKNPDALKKLNNLSISQQIYLEYMLNSKNIDALSNEEKRFAVEQAQYFKNNGFVTRLPPNSYRRMAREVFQYPEDGVAVPQTSDQTQIFKKTNIQFARSLAGEKIKLSSFNSEYKQLTKTIKDDILSQMVSKIQKVESL